MIPAKIRLGPIGFFMFWRVWANLSEWVLSWSIRWTMKHPVLRFVQRRLKAWS